MLLTTSINLQIQSAINFINLIANNSLYLYLGQQTTWPDDYMPPLPTDSVNQYKLIWDNMIGMKLVNLNNMQLVIPRVNWQSNTSYYAYNDLDGNLFNNNSSIYIINSNNEIFKCLANGNSISTITPYGLGLSSNNYIQTLNDGYSWKYMYQVQPNDAFFNGSWIPVYSIAPNGSTQQIIENAAVTGSIDILNIQNSGNNYANGSQQYILTITGDGTEANAFATVVNGNIIGTNMVNRGKNYTYATVSISDPNGSGASIIPVMSPFGGNGSNPVEELGAKNVMISISTIGTENGYISANCPFRQDGLLLNPLQYSSNTIASNTNMIPYMSISVSSGVGNYNFNEIVYQGSSLTNYTFIGTMIDFNSTTGLLTLNNVKGTPQNGYILYGSQTNAQRYVTNITQPNVQKYTGTLLNIDNEIPIQRIAIQTENFQYVINP